MATIMVMCLALGAFFAGCAFLEKAIPTKVWDKLFSILGVE